MKYLSAKQQVNFKKLVINKHRLIYINDKRFYICCKRPPNDAINMIKHTKFFLNSKVII